MRYSFESFTLDTDRRELWRGAELVAIAPQAFDLLSYLIRNRNRVVSKDDLMAAIWNGRIVSESALTTRLNIVRNAIGDNALQPRFVKTFLRKGIRFVASILEEHEDTHIAAPVISNEPLQKVRSAAGRVSITVLSFANLSGEPNLEAACESLTEDLSDELSKFRELVVIVSASRFVAGDTYRDMRGIGRELGTRYVLQGSVRASRLRLRVTARLVDATTAEQLWGRHFDGAYHRNPTYGDEFVQAIVSAMMPAIRQADLQRSHHKGLEQLGAWEAYQRGRWHMSKSEASENLLARSLFQHAVELDPNFGLGYSAIAFTFAAASSAFSEMSIVESCEIAEPLVRKALALDENDTDAHSRLALLALLRGDLDAAVRKADSVLAVHDSCPDAWGVKGAALIYAGRRQQGRNAIKRYFSLNPRDIARPIRRTQIASSFYMDGRYQEAAQTARQIVQNYPEHPLAYRWLAASLGQLGRADEAQQALQQLRRISPSSFEMYILQPPPRYCSVEYVPMLQGLRKAGWKE